VRKLTVFLAVVIIGAVAAVSFIYSGLYDVSANSPHSGIISWLLSTTSHASVERRARSIEVPDLSDDALALAGVNDFNSMCAGCHGAPGQEPEAMGIGLNPPAPDLAEEAAEMTAAELFWVTKNGIRMTGMPAWGKSHVDDDLWPVIALLIRLPELDSEAYEAMLATATGMGHHSADAPAAEHSHNDQPDDHSTHENP
jgi:mono/diheme cytochrome c family protein